MLSSCICSTLVCAMESIPIGPLAQWGKDLTYYLTPSFCLVNWDMYYPGNACRGTDLPPGRILYIHYIHTWAASWRKRLGARLPPLGFRVRVSVPPCGFRGGRNGVWVGFSRGFSRFPLPPISFHHFSILISSISFHFIRLCDGASGMVGRHPCYSRTYNVGLHRISSLDPTLCWTWVEDIYNPHSATGRAVWLAVISWKMPCTSQSTMFIFQVVKLLLYQAAGNTLINTEGTSKLSYSRTSFSATSCYKNKIQYTNFIKVTLQPIDAGRLILRDETELVLGSKRVK